LTETLTIPLRNIFLENRSGMKLGDSRIVAWATLPDATRGLIQENTGSKYDFVLQTPARNERVRTTLDRALTVFKLFKDNLVLANYVFGQDTILDSPPHYTHWLDEHRGLPEFRLSQSEESEFAKFWNEFIDLPPENFAVFRFHLADYRPYSRDRYTDYVESLEYLLVPDSDEGEISYKFRSRGCLILSKSGSAAERKRLYVDLRDAYSLRSAILHGDSKKETRTVLQGRWEDKLRPVREYDREAIKYFFKAGCLVDSEKRRELLERELVLEARLKSLARLE
jgi:hypothetical protein